MRIGLLTLPLWYNYGGILQAYALKETLKNLGHTPVLINYHHQKSTSLTTLKNTIKRSLRVSLKPETPYYPNFKELHYISQNTLEFIAEKFELKTPFVDHMSSLSAATAGFDALIAGSDQIWRPNYTPNIFHYFLDFAKPKQLKLAYAASFGTDDFLLSQKEAQVCKALVQKFKGVSVREDSGVDLCQKHFGYQAEQLVDPVFLLDKSHYHKLMTGSKNQETSGKLFSYVLDESANKKQFIQNVAIQKDLNVFKTMPRPFDKDFKNNKPIYRFPPVGNYLRSFEEADFVITDSFHGCVFSLIFNKPFIALGNEERGLARFTSLLRLFNLENRLLTQEENINSSLLTTPINWELVNTIIKEQQKKSFAFLTKNLRNED